MRIAWLLEFPVKQKAGVDKFWLVAKTYRVITSCKSRQQLKVAARYASLALDGVGYKFKSRLDEMLCRERSRY